jgi:hypothetical protein
MAYGSLSICRVELGTPTKRTVIRCEIAGEFVPYCRSLGRRCEDRSLAICEVQRWFGRSSPDRKFKSMWVHRFGYERSLRRQVRMHPADAKSAL